MTCLLCLLSTLEPKSPKLAKELRAFQLGRKKVAIVTEAPPKLWLSALQRGDALRLQAPALACTATGLFGNLKFIPLRADLRCLYCQPAWRGEDSAKRGAPTRGKPSTIKIKPIASLAA